MKLSGKSSGSIGIGIFFVAVSVLASSFYAIGVSFAYNVSKEYGRDDHFASYFSRPEVIAPMVFVALIILLLLVMGIISIKKGLTDKKVKAHGKKSVCTIKEFKVTHSRFSASLWMDVSYKTQSGKKDIYSARVRQDAINRFQQGMTIECYVLDEDCYVDPNNLRAVEKEELF